MQSRSLHAPPASILSSFKGINRLDQLRRHSMFISVLSAGAGRNTAS